MKQECIGVASVLAAFCPYLPGCNYPGGLYLAGGYLANISCTCPGGMYLLRGDVNGQGGNCPGDVPGQRGGCNWGGIWPVTPPWE